MSTLILETTKCVQFVGMVYCLYMGNFKVFDGNNNEFDERITEPVPHWVEVGTYYIFVKFAESISRPLPILY